MKLEPDVQGQLEPRTLIFFLRYYDKIEGQEVTEGGVRRALRATVIHSETSPPILTPLKSEHSGEKKTTPHW